MDRTPEWSTCAEFADDLAVLAAGALTGRERAAVLVHVEHCPYCSVELESLSSSADALLRLYPEIEPPEGFADQVLARIRQEQRARWSRRPRVLAAVAAVVAVLGLAAGLTASLLPDNTPVANNLTTATATLQSPSGPRGSVSLTSANGGWLVMTLDARSLHGVVTCRVTLADGSNRVIGRFNVTNGYGSWAARLPVKPSDVRAVSVVDPTGAVVASARIA